MHSIIRVHLGEKLKDTDRYIRQE